MADLTLFCCLKLKKYLKNLSLRMKISNTNEYLVPIIYTCIYYNPPMNPYNLIQQSFYPVGDTIALVIYLFIIVFILCFRPTSVSTEQVEVTTLRAFSRSTNSRVITRFVSGVRQLLYFCEKQN